MNSSFKKQESTSNEILLIKNNIFKFIYMFVSF